MTTARHAAKIGATAAIVAAGAVAGGCGDGDAPAARATVPPPITAAQANRLATAEHRLIARCVRAHGLRLPAATAAQDASRSSHTRKFPYGIDDVTHARRHGFGATDAEAAAKPKPRAARPGRDARRLGRLLAGDPRRVVTVRLPTGYVVAASRTGCISEARQRLYGDHARWFRANTVVVNLKALTQQRVTGDPRFRAANRDWSACVHRAGYTAATPRELRKSFAKRSEGRAPQARRKLERSMATAEARCARATELATTGRALERRVSTEVDERFAAAIATQRRLERGALERVRRHLI